MSAVCIEDSVNEVGYDGDGPVTYRSCSLIVSVICESWRMLAFARSSSDVLDVYRFRSAIPVRRRADGDRHCAQDAGFLLLADARFHLVYSRGNVHRLASAVRHEQTAEQCSNIAVRVNAHAVGCL
jgi:hypothetical protein